MSYFALWSLTFSKSDSLLLCLNKKNKKKNYPGVINTGLNLFMEKETLISLLGPSNPDALLCTEHDMIESP
jgi:hypothetical protein